MSEGVQITIPGQYMRLLKHEHKSHGLIDSQTLRMMITVARLPFRLAVARALLALGIPALAVEEAVLVVAGQQLAPRRLVRTRLRLLHLSQTDPFSAHTPEAILSRLLNLATRSQLRHVISQGPTRLSPLLQWSPRNLPSLPFVMHSRKAQRRLSTNPLPRCLS